jgi:hypothetical protein
LLVAPVFKDSELDRPKAMVSFLAIVNSDDLIVGVSEIVGESVVLLFGGDEEVKSRL